MDQDRVIDRERSDWLKTGVTEEVEDDSDGAHTLQEEDNLSFTREYTNCLFTTAQNIQHLGFVFFWKSIWWYHKMCEISLRDKIYESLHRKNFVFYCCSEIMTNNFVFYGCSEIMTNNFVFYGCSEIMTINYAVNQLIRDCLKMFFNVRHYLFFTLTFLKVLG